MNPRWNVVATVHSNQNMAKGRELLNSFGPAEITDYYDVLVVTAEDPAAFLEAFRGRAEREPQILSILSRVIPMTQTFTFQTPEEFKQKAKEALRPLIEQIAGKSFHVRMHRRGFKHRISSHEEERELAEYIFDTLEKSGKTPKIRLEDSDVLVDIETIGQEAGVSLWSRQDLLRYPFLKVA